MGSPATLDRAESVIENRKLETGELGPVLRIGPYKFYFFSHEPNEPPHVHIDRDMQSAKIRLEPVSLARNLRFSSHGLRRIVGLAKANQDTLKNARNGYFGGTSR